MRVWWELSRRSFRRHATYRAATIGGLVPNVAFGYLRAYILLAVVGQVGTVGGFDRADVVTYSFATQALIVPIAIFLGGGSSIDLAERIKTGDVVTDLYRPVDFQGYWLAQDLGRATHGLLARGLASFCAGFLAFRLVVPDTIPEIGASALTLLLAVLVSFTWRYLLTLAGFWLIDDRGLVTLAGVLAMFLSGFLVPVSFFPDWLQAVAAASPFPAMVQLPVDVFLGHEDGGDVLGVVAVQLAWIAVLGAAGRAVGALALRKVVVQGG
jgi:ABC-2 type transport system permease protein